jgi:hypothetical protein
MKGLPESPASADGFHPSRRISGEAEGSLIMFVLFVFSLIVHLLNKKLNLLSRALQNLQNVIPTQAFSGSPGRHSPEVIFEGIKGRNCPDSFPCSPLRNPSGLRLQEFPFGGFFQNDD